MELMNIDAKVVRYVDNETKKSTQMDYDAVKKIAEQKELDVILLSNSSDIPVVTIGDYNKIIFDKKKKEKENLKKQKENIQSLKEIRMSHNIADNDLKIKAKNIDKFLRNGDKVLITVRYKGRAAKFMDGSQNIINKLLEYCTESYTVSSKLSIDNNSAALTISPIKSK